MKVDFIIGFGVAIISILGIFMIWFLGVYVTVKTMELKHIEKYHKEEEK